MVTPQRGLLTPQRGPRTTARVSGAAKVRGCRMIERRDPVGDDLRLRASELYPSMDHVKRIACGLIETYGFFHTGQTSA